MNLNLIKNETIAVGEKILNIEIRFNFFKNLIRKDIEVAIWINKFCENFSEIQLYSDFRSELDSFEQVVSFLMGIKLDFQEDTLEYEISGHCSEII